MLILASGSRYRRELLGRLGLPFETRAPAVDEHPLEGESPAALAQRLAEAKARAAGAAFDEGHAIGSDQVCACEGAVLGKPGTLETAAAQLRHLSGRTASFHTAVAVLDLAGGGLLADAVETRVRFRTLGAAEIGRYLEREPALDCAGAFKSEGLGISLVESIEDDDPTALIGLPLVRLAAILRELGYDIP